MSTVGHYTFCSRCWTIQTHSFPNLEPVCCSMSSSNCCFLTCIQISQEARKVVWYSHHLNNAPQFAVFYIVKGFGVINIADILLDSFCFFYDPEDVGNLSLVPLPFLNPDRTSRSSWLMYCWSSWFMYSCSLAWRILSITLSACEMSAIVR